MEAPSRIKDSIPNTNINHDDSIQPQNLSLSAGENENESESVNEITAPSNNMSNVPVVGQKRDVNGFAFHSNGLKFPQDDITRSASDGSFVKLFVGYVPKTISEDEVRRVFSEYGNLLEVALVKDKTSGQQKGCCFVKYAAVEEADKAIKALHNICILPGGTFPIHVRYADGELERLGTMEHKLFVGSLNKQATEKEIEEIFARYGQVESIYLMKDELKQNRGSAFVKYVSREMAMAAIHALNGSYVMEGCNYPLTVRIAELKRRRVASNYPYPVSQGHAFSSGPHGQTGPRPTLGGGWGIRGRPSTNWLPTAAGTGAASHAVLHLYGNQLMPRGGHIGVASPAVGSISGQVHDPTCGHIRPLAQMTAPYHEGFNPSSTQQQSQAYGLQQSQMQQQLQAPAQQQTQSYGQKLPNMQQQLQAPMQMQQGPQAQPLSNLPSQHVQQSLQHGQMQRSLPALSLNEQFSVSKPHQVQQQAASPLQWAPRNVPQFNLPVPEPQNLQPQAQVQPQQQSLIQLVQLQLPAVHANFQTQHQYSLGQQYPALQQQTPLLGQQQQHLMQIPTKSLQNQSGHNQQQPWLYVGQPNAALVTTAMPTAAQPATIAITTTTVEDKTPHTTSVTCNWTEYTSVEGYKYYYNSVTGESKWEKPMEMINFEQWQKQPSTQLQQSQSHSQVPSQHLQQTQVQQTANPMQQQQSYSQVTHQQLQQPAIAIQQPQTQVPQPQSHSWALNQQLQQSQVQQPATTMQQAHNI